MTKDQLSVVLQTILEKNGIKKELTEIQKIVDKDMIKIIPKLEATSLKNDLQSISNEITQTLNSTLGIEVTLDAGDVFKSLNQELKQISTTTAQISTELKGVTEQLSQSLNTSKCESTFDSVINKIKNIKTLLSPDAFTQLTKNLD